MRDQQFADLVGRHQIQLMGYIYAMVHNLEDAEDVYQQTSIVLWRKFDDYTPGSDFLAWAATIARYEVLNFVRTKKTRDRYFSDGLISEIAADQNEDAAAEGDERRAALVGCVEKLPESDRRLIEQCYAGSQSVRQVAEDLDRPVKSVYASLSRIRRVLSACITRVLSLGGDA